MDLKLSNKHYRVRLANPNDNHALCQLLSSVVSKSTISMIEERDPEFFRLRQLQDAEFFCWIIESIATKEIVGCITFVTRLGWAAGQTVKIGYVCDVRLSEHHRKHSIMPRLFREIAKQAWASEYDFVYTSTVASNEQVTKITSIAGGQLWTRYQMKSVTFFGRVAKPLYPVYQAKTDDLDELTLFIQAQERNRLGGYQVTTELLKNRLQQWEGFSIENFYFCRDEKKQICAVAAPWDTNVLRRSRVTAYSGSMRFLKNLYNLEAGIRRKIKLPKPGDYFRYLTLTHLNVSDDNPNYLNALLKGIYRDYQDKPYHFMSAFIPEGSSLETSFSGLRTQAVDFRLQIYVNPNSRLSGLDIKAHRPGFEMALH